MVMRWDWRNWFCLACEGERSDRQGKKTFSNDLDEKIIAYFSLREWK